MRVLKVRVVKSSKPSFWYSKNIDSVYYVVGYNNDNYSVIASTDPDEDIKENALFLGKYDVEIIYECEIKPRFIETQIYKPTVKKYLVLYITKSGNYKVSVVRYKSLEDFNSKFVNLRGVHLIQESVGEEYDD